MRRAMIGVDARDKLVVARRRVDDARTVIRHNVVSKVGDLRAVLPRKKEGSKRGRPVKDLRSSLSKSRRVKHQPVEEDRPELVYAQELPKNNYKAPSDTNVTLGKGGKVIVSRQRGKSIDDDPEEHVQPTGIPMHMRRQPPPTRQTSHTSSRSRQQHRRQSRSPAPPTSQRMPTSARPESYARGMKGRQPAHREDNWAGGDDFGREYEYRHRSRSPLNAANYPNSANMRAYRSRSRERFERPSPPHQYHVYAPAIDHRRQMDSPGWGMVDVDVRDGREYRDAYQPRSLSPPPREHRDNRQHFYMPHQPYSEPYHSEPRVDRAPQKTAPPPSRSERPGYAKNGQRRHSDSVERRTHPPQEMMSHAVSTPQSVVYCIQVTSLSHDVTEDDVVELFSDIGPLVSAKLMKKGHAEVCFVNRKDAKIAIDKYDRRELDGIPMSLRLIEKPAGVSQSTKTTSFSQQSKKHRFTRKVQL